MKSGTDRTKNVPAIQTGLLRVVALLILMISMAVFVFTRSYATYTDGILYAERLNQMKEVTGQLFSGLEDVVETQWYNAEVQTGRMVTEKPATVNQLLTFMKSQAALSKLEQFGMNLVAVDNRGRYYTQGGTQGLLSEMELLADSPDQISFVSTSITKESTQMLFLCRLDKPIQLQDGEKSLSLIYYGITRNMTELNQYFNCEAYEGKNAVYVLDNQGAKLFSGENGGNYLDGFNAYSALQKMRYLHGTSFDEALNALQQNGTSYSNAVLNGEECYYALYRMDNAAWQLLFIVPSRYVAVNTVNLVNSTTKLVLFFAICMVVICALCIYWVLRQQQKQALRTAEENNAVLSAKNAQLEEAQAAAAKALQAAEVASQAKTDFLSNMSHDIRTPMNAIVGITKLMAHDKDDVFKMETYIHKVQMSSQYLLSLINDVLDMSKIESGKVVLNNESVSLAEQVGQIESIIRPQVEEHHQKFVVRTHEIRHEYLVCDAVRMRQILVNLLSNATKYTQEGGKITLDLAELPCNVADHAKYAITVEDNGYGMKPDFVEHIFEPFTRAENSVTNKVQGTGLGMAITKNIVDLMGGTITVQSELHKGSRFEVTLTIPIDKSAVVELPCRSVLLISDEEDFIANALAAFSGTDIALAVARTEVETDAALARGAVDIVLLGNTLQGKNLADNLQRLRQKTGDALLFYCCKYEQQTQLENLAANGGVDAVLARPLFLSNLANAIDRARNNVPVNEDEEGTMLHGMHFLCAEDNALNAEILEAILDMNQATCKIYPNGQELVDAFASVRPGEYDAILMDVQMPVMNGLEATKAIRNGENPLGRKIPIIAMTANAFSEDVQHCLDAGMDAHVAKPLDVATLERTLRSLITPPPEK
ncbi:ATP-binding response regulator [Gemmiger sp.]